MIIYFDMDGTIADYEKRFIEIWGKELFEKFKTMSKEEKAPYQEKMAEQDFYKELDPMPMLDRMHTLFRNGVDVAILTSIGKVKPMLVSTQKLEWLKEHCSKDLFNHLVMNARYQTVFTSKAKANYAGPNTCLVDDREKAWRPFLEAGGSVVVV
ncbi:MAG: hypothetical protein [Caudoviricetes sp.]|nr:MAG: hypothetical protein [Caudoviricetes sp.]